MENSYGNIPLIVKVRSFEISSLRKGYKLRMKMDVFGFPAVVLCRGGIFDRVFRMKDDVLPIQVKGVMPTASGCAVFLGNEDKVFVVYVDPGIGNTISMTINDVKKERPMTHDLIGNIFKGFGIQLERMVINDVDEGTYYARLILRMENEVDAKLVEIDARPSDSLVLALQQKKPIFVDREVFEKVDDMTEILEKITNQEGGGE